MDAGEQNYNVFIINLKKDFLKKKHMINLCNKNGISPSFINAVDGISLKGDQLYNETVKKRSITEIGRELTLGELGCALSHIKIFKLMIDKNISSAFIFEDDVNFDHRLSDYLKDIEKLPLNWDIVLLGHHRSDSRSEPTSYNIWFKKRMDSINTNLRKPAEIAYGTYGYHISLRGAKKLLSSLSTLYKPIDHYTGNSSYINLYILENPIIDINKDFELLSNLSFTRNQYEQYFFNIQIRTKTRIFLDRLYIYSLIEYLYSKMVRSFGRWKIMKRYK